MVIKLKEWIQNSLLANQNKAAFIFLEEQILLLF